MFDANLKRDGPTLVLDLPNGWNYAIQNIIFCFQRDTNFTRFGNYQVCNVVGESSLLLLTIAK
jgi:hypothetical protein